MAPFGLDPKPHLLISSGVAAITYVGHIWKEGKIGSKNYRRIVVLPYVKENGEYVHGHTKNSPSDGKALPRHLDHFLELPFEVLEGDLMIGLFGELPYE